MGFKKNIRCKKRDIWNPWHGCIKYSEGCKNCYMYYLDKIRGNSGAYIYKVKNNFYYPLAKNRHGEYKIKSGESIRVCMTSDFFLDKADNWREEAWQIIYSRPDVIFILITKRAERIYKCLPNNWHNGWENVFLHITCENQQRADERIPILLDLPFKHKGIICAPMLSEINILKYLQTKQIQQVICGGENYNGARICNFDWIKKLRADCVQENITFCFMETGTIFMKDKKIYHLPNKDLQSKMAFKSGMNYQGKDIHFNLYDNFGRKIPLEKYYQKQYIEKCSTCASKLICNGCSHCNKNCY